jgi:hypothetical protein
MRIAGWNLLLLACVSVTSTTAAEPLSEAARSFIAHHCLECHRGDKPQGDTRLDGLSADLDIDANRKLWQSAIQRIRAGEMPPKEKPRPTADEIKVLTQWHEKQSAAAAARRRAAGRVVYRRLNRTEYENTVRDLLGIEANLTDLLPLDSSADGFDNVGDALHTSTFLLDRYLEAADVALSQAIVNRPQRPPLIDKRYRLTDSHQVKATTEKVFRKSEDGQVVMFCSSAWQSVGLTGFYPPDRGHYRFRISCSATQSGDKPVTFRVWSGAGGMGGSKGHLVSYFDALPGESQVIEFIDKMEPRTTISILPYGLPSAQAVHKIGAETYEGPGLAVDWIEVEGPLHETWPPPSHRAIFGDLQQAPAPVYNQRDRIEVTSDAPREDAEQILRRFVRRAFRRSVTESDLQPLLKLVERKLGEKQSFEQAIRVALAAALISPEFLFLREEPGKLSDFALANRLSYFLWSSMPDEELLSLAEQKRLREPAVLKAQVERMLSHPKANAFTENFVGQWLGLRDIDFTMPSHILYPDYDDMLKVSMVRETELFFAEVLRENLSLTNLLASDFTMLNGRLAKHYGIPGIEGWEFKKTPLPLDSHRGGVLTMASVLKVTANGTNTSPVMRGAWVLERILGTPPPKPPENIAALEPDIRGATTIRQQLAKHRQIESCASCHVKIDPPGFALESFDVIGGWREFYRTSGNGKSVTIDGRRMPYLQGPPVDPADKLPDGRAFANIDEFKRLLLENKEHFARALTTKLVTYATGGSPQPEDQAEIDAIVKCVAEQGDGFRTLIHEIVQSKLFQSK